MELRSELVAITRGARPAARLGGSRAWTLLAAAALLGAMLIGGALMAGSGFLRSTTTVLPSNPPGATATPTPLSSAPVPSDKPWPTGPWDGTLAWPGTGASPAGLYVWDPLGVYDWMHKVPYGPTEDDSVELRFRVTTQPNEIDALAETIASSGDALDRTHPIEDPEPGRRDMGRREWGERRERRRGRAGRAGCFPVEGDGDLDDGRQRSSHRDRRHLVHQHDARTRRRGRGGDPVEFARNGLMPPPRRYPRVTRIPFLASSSS